MERDLLETCSKTVQDGIIYMNKEIENSTNHDLSASPAFLALSKVNSDKPIDYIWNDRVGENIDNYIYENIDLLVHFSKLYLEYEGDSWEEHDQLRYARNKLIGVQMAKSDFAITDYPLGGGIWFLAQETKNRKNKSIQEVINQLIGEDQYISEYIHSLTNISINILALLEVREKEYQKTLEMSDQLASKVEDLIDGGEYPIHENIHYYSYILMALSQVKKNYTVTDRLRDGIKEAQSSNGSFTDHIAVNGLAVLALIYCGEGPKISVQEMEKRIRQKDNEIKRSKAHFVSTIPSTRQEIREISIQENIEEMIINSEDIIRISILRIGMIHEK